MITDDEKYAEEFGEETWGQTKDPEKKMKEEQDEEERKKAEEAAKAMKEEEEEEEEEEEDGDDDEVRTLVWTLLHVCSCEIIIFCKAV